MKETTKEASFSQDMHVRHELWPDVLLDIETFSRGLIKSLWLKINIINVSFLGTQFLFIALKFPSGASKTP